MSFSIATFRSNFPEFASEINYPDSMITFWKGIGEKRLNVVRWADLLDEALQLYTAHHIAISAMNISDVAIGGDPGQGGGVVSSESVGGVSVSIDTGSTLEDGAGYWNSTIYGKQFYSLARSMIVGVAFIA